MTKRERQFEDYRREMYAVEFLGGPLDGEERVVPYDTGIMHIRFGGMLHVYERGDQHMGDYVREVFRHANSVRVA